LNLRKTCSKNARIEWNSEIIIPKFANHQYSAPIHHGLNFLRKENLNISSFILKFIINCSFKLIEFIDYDSLEKFMTQKIRTL